MPAVLEPLADVSVLLLIALTLLLYAMLLALRSGVHLFTNPIRGLSVAHVHFGAPLANVIDDAVDSVIHWVRHWLDVEVHWLEVLLTGLCWTIVETVIAVQDAYAAVSHALDRTWNHFIPAAIRGLEAVITGQLAALSVRIHNLRTDLSNDVTNLLARIGHLAVTVPHLIDAAIDSFYRSTVVPIRHGLHVLEDSVADVVLPRIGRLEDLAQNVRSEFAYAVATIEEVLPRLGDISYDDLRDFIDRLPWRKIGALLSVGFLTHYLVRALAREAGLDRAECRRKVKGVCGADNLAWDALLATLAGGLTLIEFREIVSAGREVMHEIQDELVTYGRGH